MSNEFRYFVTALNEYNNNDKQKKFTYTFKKSFTLTDGDISGDGVERPKILKSFTLTAKKKCNYNIGYDRQSDTLCSLCEHS